MWFRKYGFQLKRKLTRADLKQIIETLGIPCNTTISIEGLQIPISYE